VRGRARLVQPAARPSGMGHTMTPRNQLRQELCYREQFRRTPRG
jgi:hypothetical protein